MLHRLHLVVGVHDVGADGGGAVVLEEVGVVVVDPLPDGLGDLRAAGRAVFGDGDAAEGDDHFREDAVGQGNAGDGEAGGGGRVGVDHGVDVGPLPVEEDVHADLGGGGLQPADLPALEVGDDEVLGLEEALGHAGGCGEDAVVVEAAGDVAVVGGDVASLVDAAPGFDDVELGLVEVHGERSGGRGSAEAGERASTRSTMPAMTERMGGRSTPRTCAAATPWRRTITVSPTPAPTVSTASKESPSLSPVGRTG